MGSNIGFGLGDEKKIFLPSDGLESGAAGRKANKASASLA